MVDRQHFKSFAAGSVREYVRNNAENVTSHVFGFEKTLKSKKKYSASDISSARVSEQLHNGTSANNRLFIDANI